MLTHKDLDELEVLQPWAQLTKEQHHELFSLARESLTRRMRKRCPHGYTGGTLCKICRPGTARPTVQANEGEK